MAKESSLKPGWLGKILKEVENDIRLWPEWMRQEPHFKNLPPMKQLLFGKGLMKPTLVGEKLITIRKYRKDAHDFINREAFLGVFKDGLNIILQATADTEVKLFREITDSEAREDGYRDAKDAFESLKIYYPDLLPIDKVAIIRFKILQIDNLSVVSTNEYGREQ